MFFRDHSDLKDREKVQHEILLKEKKMKGKLLVRLFLVCNTIDGSFH